MRYVLLFVMLITASSISKSKPVPGNAKEKPKVKTAAFVNWAINDKPKHQWDNVDWMAKMLMSETFDSTATEAIRLMAITAAVHAEMAGTSIKDAILKKGAFSGVNKEGYIWWRAEPTATHKKIAIDIVKNGIKKHEPRVYAFCNMGIISESNRRWFKKLRFYKKIQDVTFFLLP